MSVATIYADAPFRGRFVAEGVSLPLTPRPAGTPPQARGSVATPYTPRGKRAHSWPHRRETGRKGGKNHLRQAGNGLQGP